MTYIKKTLLETSEIWLKRQWMAQFSIAVSFAVIVYIQLLSNIVSDILSLAILTGFVLVMLVTRFLIMQYSWSAIYNVLANALLSYICLAIYLSDMDVRIQMLLIPLLPLLFYILNPLWLFNLASLVFLAVLMDVREVYLQSESGRFEDVGLVLLAYALVWAVLLSVALVHRRDRARLQTYMDYNEESGVINPKALLSVLEKSVANAIRYEYKMSLVVFEFFSVADNSKVPVSPGSQSEQKLLASVAANIRLGDTLAKWKGNTFVLIVPESDEPGSEKLLLKLGQIISNSRLSEVSSQQIHYGIAVLQHQSHIELLTTAEQALDTDKRQLASSGI